MQAGQSEIAIIGLGYVGLPLAIEFAKQYPVVGFDINVRRIEALQQAIDNTKEVDEEVLSNVLMKCKSNAKGLFCTSNTEDLKSCDTYIITVPTPVDQFNKPDLNLLFRASELVGSVIKKGDIVIYESTVYPGCTEEECVPIIENASGLKYNEDFFCGYSPERINPGDKTHRVVNVRKITSGSTPAIAKKVDNLYKSIIVAGTFMAKSIKIAEAAKAIENAQRDINIAFVNELAKIFNRMNIDTNDVLEAAATKWNFLPFKPGLVGGHCISVDPYYLAYKAEALGHRPEIILSGRMINDGMGSYIGKEVVKLLVKKSIPVKQADVLILGITFKENCPDIRNTRVIDIIEELKSFSVNVTVYDPLADSNEVKQRYGVATLKQLSDNGKFDAIVLAVAHNDFLNENWKLLLKDGGVIYDVKGVLKRDLVDSRL